MTRPFTGRHFLIILLSAFGLVTAVNITMAVLATRSHTGMVVDSSYIAGQQFNDWIEAGRRQQQQGWHVTVRLDGPLLVVDARSPLGTPLEGAKVAGELRHPMGASPPVALTLTPRADGLFVARHGLGPGQWDAELWVTRGNEQHLLRQRLIVADG